MNSKKKLFRSIRSLKWSLIIVRSSQNAKFSEKLAKGSNIPIKKSGSTAQPLNLGQSDRKGGFKLRGDSSRSAPMEANQQQNFTVLENSPVVENVGSSKQPPQLADDEIIARNFAKSQSQSVPEMPTPETQSDINTHPIMPEPPSEDIPPQYGPLPDISASESNFSDNEVFSDWLQEKGDQYLTFGGNSGNGSGNWERGWRVWRQ